MEITIETKKCKQCWTSFDITDKDKELLNKLSPVIENIKYDLPIPEICPTCRQQQRCCFRNRRNLYKRTCDLTGKPIISMYSLDKPFKIYYNKDYENSFDAITKAKEINFDKSILEQFRELQLEVPRFHSAVLTDTMVNSEYVNGSHGTKDSYLSFSITESESVYYSEWVYYSKDCMDCYQVRHSEICYECIESSKMYKSFRCSYCIDCSDCLFCFNCENCSHCFGCVNQIGKKYMIFNQQFTKEEYEQEIAKHTFSRSFIQETKKKFNELKIKSPHKYARVINIENSVWDSLINTKDCINCFGMEEAEDTRHCYFLNKVKSCMDVLFFGSNVERSYRTVSTGSDSQNIYFCLEVYGNTSNVYYCDSCTNVKNCFACVGLRNKEYCIFNKQYTREEYSLLIPKIIKKMESDWERWYFFPASYSPFGYNESYANEHFPLTKEEAIKKWFNWMDKEYFIDVPKNFESDPEIVICETTKKPFRLVKQELDFYKKYWLPLPTKHPNQRHKERFEQVNPRKLRDRKCTKCSKDIKTSYAPERPEIIYCESCYNKEVYG